MITFKYCLQKKKAFSFFFFFKVCVYICSCVCMSMCGCMWSPEVSSSGFSPFWFWRESLTEPGAQLDLLAIKFQRSFCPGITATVTT